MIYLSFTYLFDSIYLYSLYLTLYIYIIYMHKCLAQENDFLMVELERAKSKIGELERINVDLLLTR